MLLAGVATALAVALGAALVALARERAGRRRADAERRALEARLDAEGRALEAERARLGAAAREAREAAARAGRARDDLVAMASHELRTPLNTVLGWARLLRTGKLDAAAIARAVETLERSAAAQARIVDDLLDVARIERGELRLDVRRVELVPVIEAAIAAIRPAAEARNLSLTAALIAGANAVAGDPGRLQQVVWQLLANAVKFTPPGGRVEVRLDEDGDDAVILVRDDGEGIDPHFLPHAFEPFRQADSSSTRAHGGLGVGLALVRHLVEAHGGEVAAASDGKGRGSTFTVRLPISAVPAHRARPAPRPPPPAPGPSPRRDER
jgi:signal transduction histidine kinase